MAGDKPLIICLCVDPAGCFIHERYCNRQTGLKSAELFESFDLFQWRRGQGGKAE
jgi:hypothetical protein